MIKNWFVNVDHPVGPCGFWIVDIGCYFQPCALRWVVALRMGWDGEWNEMMEVLQHRAAATDRAERDLNNAVCFDPQWWCLSGDGESYIKSCVQVRCWEQMWWMLALKLMRKCLFFNPFLFYFWVKMSLFIEKVKDFGEIYFRLRLFSPLSESMRQKIEPPLSLLQGLNRQGVKY